MGKDISKDLREIKGYVTCLTLITKVEAIIGKNEIKTINRIKSLNKCVNAGLILLGDLSKNGNDFTEVIPIVQKVVNARKVLIEAGKKKFNWTDSEIKNLMKGGAA